MRGCLVRGSTVAREEIAPRARGRGRHVVAGTLALLVTTVSPARATWSIVAADPETGEVGIAGASCTGGVELIGGVVPGKGVVAAQALISTAGRDAAMRLLAADVPPPEIVARIADPTFDPGWFGWRTRQYGIVSLAPEDFLPGSFTGPSVIGWHGAEIGPRLAVQGNLLRGPEVVQSAFETFRASTGRCGDHLADRLMRALEAGARAGGDRRCAIPLGALSAFLVVARPDDPPDAPSLALYAPHDGGVDTSVFTLMRQLVFPESGTFEESAVRRLRLAYDERRRREPAGSDCPPTGAGFQPGRGSATPTDGGSDPWGTSSTSPSAPGAGS
jgi:uncharacterized Ntn-hydrolase superfamily protein